MCLCIGLYIFLILQFKVFNTVSLQQFYLQFFLPFLGMFLRCWNPNFLQLKLLTLEIGMIYDLNTVLPIIRDMVLDCNLIIVNLRNLRSTMSFLFFGTMAACHFLFFFFPIWSWYLSDSILLGVCTTVSFISVHFLWWTYLCWWCIR